MRTKHLLRLTLLGYLASAVFHCLRLLADQAADGVTAKQIHLVRVQMQAPDGKPMTNIAVVCFDPMETNAVLEDLTIHGGSRNWVTDGQGYFTLEWSAHNVGVMAAGEKGFCLAQSRDLPTNNPVLILQPWARIEGSRTDHGRPLPKHRLSVQFIGRGVDPIVYSSIDLKKTAVTDERGHFVFERVPPIDVWLQDVQIWQGANTKRGPVGARLQEVDLQPAENRQIAIGTHGRTIVGRIELGDELDPAIDLKALDGVLLRGIEPEGFSALNRPTIPAEFDTAEKRAKWYLDWFNASETNRWRKAMLTRLRAVMIHADGSFVAQMVEPGNYVLTGWFPFKRKDVAELDPFHFVVPPATNNADVMVDVGRALLRPVVMLKVGDVAPDFKVPALDGSIIKLSNLRGKYLLLDFWATWCGPCVAETPHLQAAYEAFGKDQRLVMISISSDANREAPAKFVKTKGIEWRQAWTGADQSNCPVAKDYGIMAIPQIMLIGPEGKIIARDLRGPKIKEALAAVLAK